MLKTLVTNQKNKYFSVRLVLSAILLVSVVLVYLHPYHGIRHDSTLYLAQAFLELYPEEFKHDIFFAYGSQADFTVLPGLIAQLIRLFSPANVFMGLTALSLVFFCISSYLLLRRLYGAVWAYWGLLALLIFPGGYGGNWVMSYNEAFFTGRAIAEPLVLLALFSYLKSSFKIAGAIFLVAAVIHPLQSIPFVLVVWCDLLQRNRAWLNALWIPMFLLIGSLLGMPYLERLTAQFDPQWFEWVQGPNKLTFMLRWSQYDWTFILTDFFLVGLLIGRSQGALRILASAVCCAAVIGFFSSIFFYEFARYILIGGAQLWRADWILHWMAIASMPFLLFSQFQTDGWRGIRFWSLLTIALLGTWNRMAPEIVFVVYALMPIYIFWPRISSRVGPGFRIALLYSMPLAIFIALAKAEFQVYFRFKEIIANGQSISWDAVFLAHPLIFFLLIISLVFCYRRFPKFQSFSFAALLAMLAYSISAWDARSDWTRAIENVSGDGREFGVNIEPGTQVFWSNETLAPWLVLHRASYFSTPQTAGILFNRGTAAEVMRRAGVINQLNQGVEVCKDAPVSDNESTSCNLQRLTLDKFCEAAKPDVGYVILDFIANEKYAGIWDVGVKFQGRDLTYYLYRCSDLIREHSAEAS